MKYLVWAIGAESGGLLYDYFGRRLYYPGLLSDDRQELASDQRRSFNAIIQSHEASAMQIATHKVLIGLVCNSQWGAALVCQVHDEILVECLPEYAEEVSSFVTQVFSDGCYLPLLKDINNTSKIGDSWYAVK